MSDYLQTVLGGLKNFLPKRTIVYARGENTVTLQATVASTDTDQYIENGLRIRSQIRDYLIVPGDLILDSEVVEPEDGDIITDTSEGSTSVYTVMCIDGGESWRWTDRYHTLLRVHTRET